jgi:tRNA uridine 5-carbamoylmethylation protein Kti12
MKLVYIMRGVPGSGKTTAARGIAGAHGAIHSTDDYFYENGVYRRAEEKLEEFHEKNFEAFCESLRREVPIVICDNVNYRYKNFRLYQHEGMKHGYTVAIVTMPHPYPPLAAERNIHGVPESHIRRLIEMWEL